ncbi:MULTISPECIES: hypothetical protein [Pseudomonas]|jgi:hypothetical protein|nr:MULTISPECIES: hypothetical protein [Pseudomonas]
MENHRALIAAAPRITLHQKAASPDYSGLAAFLRWSNTGLMAIT